MRASAPEGDEHFIEDGFAEVAGRLRSSDASVRVGGEDLCEPSDRGHMSDAGSNASTGFGVGARGAMAEVAGDVEPRAADDAASDSSGFCVGGVGGAGDNASAGLQNIDAYLAGVSDSDADIEVGRRSTQGVGTSARARDVCVNSH